MLLLLHNQLWLICSQCTFHHHHEKSCHIQVTIPFIEQPPEQQKNGFVWSGFSSLTQVHGLMPGIYISWLCYHRVRILFGLNGFLLPCLCGVVAAEPFDPDPDERKKKSFALSRRAEAEWKSLFAVYTWEPTRKNRLRFIRLLSEEKNKFHPKSWFLLQRVKMQWNPYLYL